MALVDWVDTFVILDNILISNSASFFLRNRILDPNGGPKWFGVSKQKTPHSQIPVKDVLLSESDWRQKLVQRFQAYYRKAPYFKTLGPAIAGALQNPEPKLARYNTQTLQVLCEILGIQTSFQYASEMMDDPGDDAQSRIIQLCLICDGTQYFNGRDGVERGLYNAESFESQGLVLFKQSYKHPTYSQAAEPFQPYLSVVDLLMHCGPDSLEILRSGQTWERV